MAGHVEHVLGRAGGDAREHAGGEDHERQIAGLEAVPEHAEQPVPGDDHAVIAQSRRC